MKLPSLVRWLLTIFWPPVLVFSLEMVRLLVLPQDMWMDVYAHLAGGAVIAWAASNAYGLLRREKGFPTLPWWMQWYVFVTSAELFGVVWEFYEYIYLSGNPANGITYADTISDLTMDLIGGSIAAIILVLVRNRLNKKTKTTG